MKIDVISLAREAVGNSCAYDPFNTAVTMAALSVYDLEAFAALVVEKCASRLDVLGRHCAATEIRSLIGKEEGCTE